MLSEDKIWQKIEKGVFVIAEIGKNFIETEKEKSSEEYLNKAKELIKAAQYAGADAVKFQTHNIEDEQMKLNVVSPHFSAKDRYNWVSFNSRITTFEFWQEINNFCQSLGIIFFSTPMSRGAALKLEKVGVPLWKVGSGDVLDFVMLDFLAKTKKPIIISSGMSTLEEIDKSIDFLKKRTDRVALLHCVSEYPCGLEKLNLKSINFFKKRYQIPVGFSDHSLSWQTSLAAVNIGATVIEKHFSFNRNLWGPDHKVSLEPAEFKEMVNNINQKNKIDINGIYGREDKILQSGEKVFRGLFRKSLVAGQDIAAGTVLTSEMLYAMRPQAHIKGLPSEDYEKLIGFKTKRDYKKYDIIKLDN